MQSLRLRHVLGLALAASVVACRAPIPPLRSDLAPTTPGNQAAQATGGVVVSVVWPERITQKIPVEATRIVVFAFKAGQADALGKVELIRTSGATESVGKIADLPAGTIDLSASAMDSAGKTLAAGKTSVTILANEFAQATLKLATLLVGGFFPPNGGVGTTLSIQGLGFGGPSDLPPTVSFGPNAAGYVTRVSDTQLLVQVPDAATSDPVVVGFGGDTATSSAPFVTLKNIEISPDSTDSFSPYGMVKFQVVAKDHKGNAVDSPSVSLSTTCSSCTSPGQIVGGNMLAVGEINGDTMASVIASSGNLTRWAIVNLHPFGKPDLASSGLGPLPAAVPNATGSAAVIALGKKLFKDPNLSGNKQISCATCHDPAKGWGDNRPRALANDNVKFLPWNSLTVLDSAYQTSVFWNGRAPTLEAQAIGVFQIPLAMNASLSVIARYAGATYSADFMAAFGATQSADTKADNYGANLIAKAIAAFERTVVTPPNTAAFDKWYNGESGALSPNALRGLAQFAGKAQCVNCHTGPLLSDGKFHNIAVPSVLPPPGGWLVNARSELIDGRLVDWGRLNIKVTTATASAPIPFSSVPAALASELGTLRTPTLRNVAVTGPYMHNGSKPSLESVIEHYETFDRGFPHLSPLMPVITLTAAERAELVEFLKALTATPGVTLD